MKVKASLGKKARNPWAVCRAAAKGKKWSRAKLERCVKKVKRKR